MAARRRQPLATVLGPLEAEVMDIIWAREEVTVRDVYRDLKRARPIAYTTVMTTMGRLAEKGLLRREEEHPAHRYFPIISREQYARSTVKSVVDWLVNHFRDPAVAYFLDRVEEEDKEVIESLREAIAQRELKGK
jgi:predicted transcriptional regulator